MAGDALNPAAALPAGAAALAPPMLHRLDLRPPALLRSGHLQSLLGSLPPIALLARRHAAALLTVAQPLLLDCGQDIQLQAFYSRAEGARRLAVLLHGWEGSAQSSCVLSLAALLYRSGYHVLRLNLRDHGGSQGLNREIFHSCRLPEVLGALRAIAGRFDAMPLYLAGFSLGGNFMLRAAADAALPAAVRAVVAVSPVLEPSATLRALEQGPAMYRRSLVRRWSNSLRAKQRAWPGVHEFGELLRLADLRGMTAGLVRAHTEFANLEAYLHGYAITGQRLAAVRTRCSVLLSEDDPLIPIADAQRLAFSPSLAIYCSRYGGHCGFLPRLGLPTAADRFVREQFETVG